MREEQHARYPFWEYPPTSFNLNDIHEFSDITQVVWTIASYSDGTDLRAGLENAANGVISGWFYARAFNTYADEAAKRLHVIRQADTREVVDVGVIEIRFDELSDFVDCLNKVNDQSDQSSKVCQFGSASYEMVKAPNYAGAVDREFWIGIYPVTVSQYRAFCKATKYPEPEYWNNTPVNDNQPVVQISYTDAEGFCKWAGLELPTEDQWKYFALAGSGE